MSVKFEVRVSSALDELLFTNTYETQTEAHDCVRSLIPDVYVRIVRVEYLVAYVGRGGDNLRLRRLRIPH